MGRSCTFALWFGWAAGLAMGQTSGVTITSISNAASGAATVESGSWVSIYGTGLSATTRPWQASDFAGSALPTTLDNVSVTIDGKKAAISYISPKQLNVQAPADTATGPVPVVVTSPSGTAASSVTLANYSPAFFTITGGFAAARHNSDSSIVAPNGALGASVTTRPAVPGETLQLYATGLGPTQPALTIGQMVSTPEPLANVSQLKVTLGGTAATVQYAGLVAPGLYQVNVVVPLVDDGNQTLTATIGGANTQSGVSVAIKNSVSGTLSVTLTPSSGTVRISGGTVTLTAKVNNTSNQLVNWLVNGVAGGNATVGTISATGVYTAPAAMPPGATSVTITAVSQESSSATATATINLQNPLPAVTSVTPNPVNPGNATVTVNGSGFVNGSTIYFAGHALTTTFVSPTQLTAAGAVTMPVGRLAAVKVTNPNPGSATSTPLAVPVRVANEQMAYADAVRFLEMTTFGPTPQSVADLQAMGQDAWLAAQFNQAASTWPDPDSTTESVTRLQTAFFNVALSGQDQLRQRVAFALAQILVASAVSDGTFEQMVSYQRTLGSYAFDTYRNVVNSITLNPAMGDYLNMVNNVKATGTTMANENYARELMQLFTLGLVELDSTGQPVMVNGATVPEYDETTVQQMAKVLTGWTYGETPGFASVWPNMPYYFSPMIAFESYHDQTQKNLNLPIPCTIAAGGTAEADLSAALDCIFQQTNVAPFVAYRLIQRLVMSSPSPAYVGRVAQAWQASGGNLTNVIAQVLTDQEAQTAGTGKLAEPILYATGLLRALNATITAPDALTAQTTSMGQTPLSPPSVFSYFSPFYVIPAVTPPTVAPEFQGLNSTTVLARANFAWALSGNAVSSGITIDFSNLTDLANNPPDLVEALNQALFRGEIDPHVQQALLAAASASSNPSARVRSALYAASAAPQYEVEQ